MRSFFTSVRLHSGTIIALIIVIGVFVAISTAAITAVCGGTIPLPPGETCAQCIRAWVGSLSGWAAAAGALLTAVLLLRQIGEMQNQNDYLMGRLPVELIVRKWKAQTDTLQFNLINRNAQPIHIENLSVEDNSDVWIHINNMNLYPVGDANSNGSAYKCWRYVHEAFVLGWVNKAEVPSTRFLDVSFSTDDGEVYAGVVTFKVDYRFFGSDKIETVECTVDLDFYRERA